MMNESPILGDQASDFATLLYQVSVQGFHFYPSSKGGVLFLGFELQLCLVIIILILTVAKLGMYTCCGQTLLCVYVIFLKSMLKTAYLLERMTAKG